MSTVPDCNACGACCRNPDDNRAEGFSGWVEVAPDEPIRHGRRTAHLVALGPDGSAHLRLTPDGRCVALRGRIGVHTRCAIYAVRPRPCRRVQAGSAECLRWRAAAGLADGSPPARALRG